jgi:M6 family metalloprotease-like protein
MRLAKVSIRTYFLTALTIVLSIYPAISQSSLKTCGIRVEFIEDNNDLTTGNGRFVLDTAGVTEYTIDPPPHNRSYFQDQIIAVSNYYRQASRGQLRISGDIFPIARDQAYQLDHTMGYYNPNTNDEENNRQLAQLFIDAVQKADSSNEFTFSDFNVVTVFHAGVGKDIELGFDETPQDIPSIYFTPEFFKKYYDPNFTGIPVDDGTFVVDRGLLLPETESQVDIEIGLMGMFAANIGSHLGMYDLFSPTEQESGIGVFGVMDAGLFNALGLAPALPSAFSRNLLGWENPSELISPDENVTVYPFRGENSQGQTLYKIPINAAEFYLLENRGDYTVNIDSLYFDLAGDRETPPTYLEVFKTYLSDRIEISDSTGVLLNVENYDWGLPGSGLLVWHIDESIIDAYGQGNQINIDKNNRAVDLEEADGSQDIGYEYTIVEPGYQSELGTWLDFWFEGNPSPLYKNEFSPVSSPNTRANRTLANSHITIDNISSRNSDIITFSLHLDYFESGFPVTLLDDSDDDYLSNLLVAGLEFNNVAGMFSGSLKGVIYAVTAEGKGLLNPDEFQVAQFPDQELIHIALNDTNGNQLYDQLIAVGESGKIVGYRIGDANDDDLLDTMFVRSIDDKITTLPVISHPHIYLGAESGNVYRLTYRGILDSVLTYSEPIAAITVNPDHSLIITPKIENMPEYPATKIDMNSDGEWETITYPAFDRIKIDNNEIILNDDMISAPSFGDVDDDGFYELVVCTKYSVVAYNFNGVMETNFPLKPVLQPNETITGSILLFDVSGDQKTDMLFMTTAGQIFAYSTSGNLISGFPFSAGGQVSLSPIAFDIDSDDRVEIFILNDNSALFGWQLNSIFLENEFWWYQSIYKPTGNHFVAKQLAATGLPVTDLMPANKAYVYPNPNIEKYTKIRYYLRDAANVNIKIFDLAGDLVATLDAPGNGMVDNEIRWDLNGVSSGVYLCRIEAVSASEKSVQIIKVMVIN